MTEFLDIHGKVDLQDLLYRMIEVDIQVLLTFTIDEIDLWELKQILHTGIQTHRGMNIRRVYIRRRDTNSRPRQM